MPATLSGVGSHQEVHSIHNQSWQICPLTMSRFWSHVTFIWSKPWPWPSPLSSVATASSLISLLQSTFPVVSSQHSSQRDPPKMWVISGHSSDRNPAVALHFLSRKAQILTKASKSCLIQFLISFPTLLALFAHSMSSTLTFFSSHLSTTVPPQGNWFLCLGGSCHRYLEG